MVYSFELLQHANIRYREAVSRLGRCELLCMLKALGIETSVTEETLGGASFLTFDSRELTDAEILYLSGHSSVTLMAAREKDLLRPLDHADTGYLPADLPEVLKYKGKTSVAFTRMMVNIALSLTPDPFPSPAKTVLDPLCGKATTGFCALQAGMNAVCLDLDRKSLREADEYFSRYLKLHLLKHARSEGSETAGSAGIPFVRYQFADTKEHFAAKDTRFLMLAVGDTENAPALVRRIPVHAIAADLPYGIQHAPQSGRRPESFTALLRRVLPAWYRALVPGGALALSFNTLTLSADAVLSALASAGFVCPDLTASLFFRHEVEQAVVRDVIFAVKPQ